MQTSKNLSISMDPNKDAEIKFPYDISFIDCTPSDAVRFQIEQHLAKVGQLYERITDCKVAVRIPHKSSGNRYFHINIQMDVPGKRIAVSREPEAREQHTEIHAAVRDAFHKLSRQLETFVTARKNRSPVMAPIENGEWTDDGNEV